MAVIPYQPNYSVQPKYGFRYGASTFAPPQAPVTGTLDGSGATPPPVLGTGQGGQTTAQMKDPFEGNGGFEGAQKNYSNVAQSLGYEKGTQDPYQMVRMIPFVGNTIADAMPNKPEYTYGNFGTYDNQGNVFGTQGRAYDPISGMAAPSFKNFAGEDSFLGNTYGVGTEEGPLGPSSGYGKLRAAGVNVPMSLLGSYDNSVYKPMDMYSGLDTNNFTPTGPMPAMQDYQNTVDYTADGTNPLMDFSSPGAKYTDRVESIYNPELTPAQVRAYRNQGMMLPGSLEGVNSVRSQIAKNTALQAPMMGMSEDDYDRLGIATGGTIDNPVTAGMLGFDNTRPAPAPPKMGEAIGYLQGTDTGDAFRDGIVDENGRPVSNKGTSFSVTDAYGFKHSLGGTKAENKAVLDMVNEIDTDARTGTSAEERGFVENVSADNYDDKDPGTVTDSNNQTVLGNKSNPYGDSFAGTNEKSGGGKGG